jgi:hypothetical protein
MDKIDPDRPKKPKTGGRKKGVPNKTTTALKEAILAAAEAAGGEFGMVGYLHRLANVNSSAFASLLGKVLPMTVQGSETGGPMRVEFSWLPPAGHVDDDA